MLTASRSATRSSYTIGRTSTQSAGTRQPERAENVPMPTKRSSSAPKTPSSRLKTPTPLSTRIKGKQ
ncbi:hypothetical protein Q1695_000011 [Nippostrongylus brasiliensis]|nr:hypothetical protein Q1695_000011 [Nippostrongylus brasiliensis]